MGLLIGLAGCSGNASVAYKERALITAPETLNVRNEPITPIPGFRHLSAKDGKKRALGALLFRETAFSSDDSLSCASCHDLAYGGVDHAAFSIGANGAVDAVNAPTVFNATFNFKQFWDGRVETLEEQLDARVHDEDGLGSSWESIAGKLQTSEVYGPLFDDLYEDGIQAPAIQDALVAYMHSLITPDSPFDFWLEGDDSALSREELEGYHLFKDYGCIRCHQGVGVGGNMFQAFGVVRDYFSDRGGVAQADFGRYNHTKIEEHRFHFKVASLRNVALTAPYFHDAASETLAEATQIMARYQLGLELEEREIQRIERFLNTLTGEYRHEGLARTP